MSEYPHATSYLGSQNLDGTPSFFEEPTAQEVLRTVEATIDTVEQDTTEVIYFPETIPEIKKHAQRRQLARMARLAEASESEDTAYEDINPNARLMRPDVAPSTVSPIDTLVLGYENWQQEVSLAIEQFGLTSLTLELLENMTVGDRARLGRRVEQFLTLLAHRPKVIKTFGGDVTSHATFYGTYGDRSREDMLAYADSLDTLKDELLHSPVVYRLLYEAEAVQPNKAKRELCAKKEKKKFGEIQVYFETNARGKTKPCLTAASS